MAAASEIATLVPSWGSLSKEQRASLADALSGEVRATAETDRLYRAFVDVAPLWVGKVRAIRFSEKAVASYSDQDRQAGSSREDDDMDDADSTDSDGIEGTTPDQPDPDRTPRLGDPNRRIPAEEPEDAQPDLGAGPSGSTDGPRRDLRRLSGLFDNGGRIVEATYSITTTRGARKRLSFNWARWDVHGAQGVGGKLRDVEVQYRRSGKLCFKYAYSCGDAGEVWEHRNDGLRTKVLDRLARDLGPSSAPALGAEHDLRLLLRLLTDRLTMEDAYLDHPDTPVVVAILKDEVCKRSWSV